MENSNYNNKNIEKKYSSTCFHWLINYIRQPIRKTVGGFKDKMVSLFNINATKQIVHGREKKLNKPKTQKQSEKT